MFAATVSSKSTVSCVTMPIWPRSDASDTRPDVDPVDQDRSAGHVVETRHEVGQARLARAAAPHDRHGPAGVHGERHAVEGVLAVGVFVLERHVAELEALRDSGAQHRRARPCRATSVCVSSSSKIRCGGRHRLLQFAFTRLSFFSGVYISSSTATNDVNSPCVRRPPRNLTRAVPQAPPQSRRRRAAP